jgi:CheY-specific phosphatase CheX
MLAIIGFGGAEDAPSLRGSLILSANHGLLERSCPAPRVAGQVGCSAETLQDWIGELANQLLGRLKSRLLAHGVTIQLGTPTTVSGLELRVRSCAADRQATPLWFVAGDDWLVVRLDALASPNAKLESSPDPSSSAAEGDVLLF